jgi:hypothetical protein
VVHVEVGDLFRLAHAGVDDLACPVAQVGCHRAPGACVEESARRRPCTARRPRRARCSGSRGRGTSRKVLVFSAEIIFRAARRVPEAIQEPPRVALGVSGAAFRLRQQPP